MSERRQYDTSYAVLSEGPRTLVLETPDKEEAHEAARNFAPMCESVFVIELRPLVEGGTATSVDMYQSQSGEPLCLTTMTNPN